MLAEALRQPAEAAQCFRRKLRAFRPPEDVNHFVHSKWRSLYYGVAESRDESLPNR